MYNLDRHAVYAIQVAARTNVSIGELSAAITVKADPVDVVKDLRAHSVSTHSVTLSWKRPFRLDPIGYKISYSTVKEFRDSQGQHQTQVIPPNTFEADSDATQYTLHDLSPFTSYQINVTAIPESYGIRPPAKITVTTAMAGTFYG